MAPGRENTTLRPPSDELPTNVRKKKLDEFRQALYDERVDRHGYLHPSEGSSVPDEKQQRCKHPFSKLRCQRINMVTLPGVAAVI